MTTMNEFAKRIEERNTPMVLVLNKTQFTMSTTEDNIVMDIVTWTGDNKTLTVSKTSNSMGVAQQMSVLTERHHPEDEVISSVGIYWLYVLMGTISENEANACLTSDYGKLYSKLHGEPSFVLFDEPLTVSIIAENEQIIVTCRRPNKYMNVQRYGHSTSFDDVVGYIDDCLTGANLSLPRPTRTEIQSKLSTIINKT